MKKTLLFALLLCLSRSYTLAQDTTYLDVQQQETTADKAIYKRTKITTKEGWQVTDYYLSGKIRQTGVYADDSCHVRSGEFAYYTDKGILYRRISYVQDQPEGNDIYYYDSGRIQVTGTNRAGKADGEWTGHYPSGQLSGKALYVQGKQVSASFFHEDGTPDKTITEFRKDAAYPGGNPKLYSFVGKAIKYPRRALEIGIKGKVILQFKVTKEGRVDELKVVKSVERSLDAEALRVLSLMSDWEPAILGGLAVDSYYKLPISFNFE